MQDKLLQTPDGVRDTYDVECKKKRKIIEKLHHTLELYSYHDIETPTFEYFDIFNRDKGSAPSNEMYKFFDRDNNTLVLRPDITPSIARCVAKYYKDEQLPIRLCYTGNTYSNPRKLQGKLKEVTQIGAELINDDSSAADAEIIATVVDSFKALGIDESRSRSDRSITLRASFQKPELQKPKNFRSRNTSILRTSLVWRNI